MLENLYELEDELTESINISLDDQTINKAKCSLIAYNCHIKEDGSETDVIYNPKKNPDKAVDINFEYPDDNLNIEIFLDTNSKEWDSDINNGKGKLSPEQMEIFFESNFYSKLHKKLSGMWPTSDRLFGELIEAITNKKYKIDCGNEIVDEDFKFRTHNVKKGKAREKNAAGEQIRTNSGRLIEKFNDMGVQPGKNEAYYSWPGKKKDIYKWSRWADWEKQKPVMRCRFQYKGEVIGVSIGPLKDNDENRGFRAFNLSLRPLLQYLTPGETEDILKLSLVKRFLKESIRRISNILKIPDEEILKNMNNPDKCSLEQIRKTKHVIRNDLEAAKNLRADTFIYT